MPTNRTAARYSLARAYVAAHLEKLDREKLSYIEFGSTVVEFGSVDTGESIGSEVALITRSALVPFLGLKTERMTYTQPEPMRVPVIAGNTPTVAILSALDSALSIIRETNPAIPTALAVVISTGRGKFHGSFQASQWEDTDEAGQVLGKRHELVMSSESLARGGKDTLVTLIHEAMHAQAHATGVKDTSRQGRFHNEKFRTLAEGAGLTCAKDSGGSTVTNGLQTWAERLYAPVIAALDEVLTTHRIKVAPKPESAKATVRVQCGCQTPVTLPIKWYSDHGQENMLCGLCDSAGEDSHFYPVD